MRMGTRERLTNAEAREMFRFLRSTNCESTRERLIHSHTRIVYWVRRRLATRLTILPDEREDVISDGIVGLIQAVDLYDPSRGLSFFAFAKRLITRRIFDGYRRRRWLTNQLTTIHRRIQRKRTELSLQGSDPSLSELASALGMRESTVRFTLEAVGGALDLQYLEENPGDASVSYLELIPDPYALPDEIFEAKEAAEHLRQGVSELSDAERAVVMWRFGEDKTIPQIAAEQGLSEAQVKRLSRVALQDLRARFGCADITEMPGKRQCRKSRVKISEEDVRQILDRFRNDAPLKEVASEFGISVSQASLIKNGRRWRHIYDEVMATQSA